MCSIVMNNVEIDVCQNHIDVHVTSGEPAGTVSRWIELDHRDLVAITTSECGCGLEILVLTGAGRIWHECTMVRGSHGLARPGGRPEASDPAMQFLREDAD